MKLNFRKEDTKLPSNYKDVIYLAVGRFKLDHPDYESMNGAPKEVKRELFVNLFKELSAFEYDDLLAVYSEFERKMIEELKENGLDNVIDDVKDCLLVSDDGKKINDPFAKVINNFSIGKYRLMMGSLTDRLAGEGKTKEDVLQAIEQVKALENARKQKGILQTIIEFFTGKLFAESNQITEFKNGIREMTDRVNKTLPEEDKIIKDNLDLALDSNEYTPDIIYEDFNLKKTNIKQIRRERDLESRSNASIFKGLGKDFIEKDNMSYKEKKQNISLLSDAIEFYNGIKNKADKDLRNHYLQELNNKAKELNVSQELFDKAIKQNKSQDIEKELSRDLEQEYALSDERELLDIDDMHIEQVEKYGAQSVNESFAINEKDKENIKQAENEELLNNII